MTDQRAPVRGAGQTKRRPLLGLLLNAERGIRAHMDEILREYPLTTPEYTALVILRNYGPMASSELARQIFVTPQAVGQIINSVEARNLVLRHQDPHHGRKLLAELTPEGVQLVDACVEHLHEVEQRFLGVLNHREQEFFMDLLSDCVEDMNSHRKLPPPVRRERRDADRVPEVAQGA